MHLALFNHQPSRNADLSEAGDESRLPSGRSFRFLPKADNAGVSQSAYACIIERHSAGSRATWRGTIGIANGQALQGGAAALPDCGTTVRNGLEDNESINRTKT